MKEFKFLPSLCSSLAFHTSSTYDEMKEQPSNGAEKEERGWDRTEFLNEREWYKTIFCDLLHILFTGFLSRFIY